MQQQRPSVPEMLVSLASAYQKLAQCTPRQPEEEQRLNTVIDDLRWYSVRLGPERWEVRPQPDKWSFSENLWHITEQALSATSMEAEPRSLVYFVDHGKEHVGQAAEILAIFEYSS